jgi:anaerobic selenocysteine-containing dehydrogenase
MRKVAEALEMNGRRVNSEPLLSGRIHRYDFDGPTPVQFRSVFPPTPERKANLVPAVLGPEPYAYQRVQDGPYPLALISPSNNKMISSILGEFNYPELFLALHPEDASARNIGEGDRVRIFNHLGEVVCRANLSTRIRPGVVALPKGAWRKSSLNGRTSTALCPPHVNVVAGGACYNDARVEVEKVS